MFCGVSSGADSCSANFRLGLAFGGLEAPPMLLLLPAVDPHCINGFD